MSGVRRPSTPTILGRHEERLRVQERRTGGHVTEQRGSYVYEQEVFDYSSGTSDPSKRYKRPFTDELVALHATLTDDGSTATTVDILINGGAHETLTIPASSFAATVAVSHVLVGWTIGGTDYLQLEATLGTGADGLLIHTLWRRRP